MVLGGAEWKNQKRAMIIIKPTKIMAMNDAIGLMPKVSVNIR
jgi:hypothetical protein